MRGLSRLIYSAGFTLLVVSCLFAQFERTRYTINENEWKFYKGEAGGAEQEAYNDDSWLDVTIPHDYNGGVDGVNEDVFDGHSGMYRGVAWYRTPFSIAPEYEDKRIFIVFEGVNLVSDVYVNGTHVGQHKGGYTAFKYDITDEISFGEGVENMLSVKVSNANDPTVCPYTVDPHAGWPQCYDYAIYGGIYRDVWIEVSDNVKIDAVFNTPDISSSSSATLNVLTEVTNYGPSSQDVTLSTTLSDASGNVVLISENTQSISSGETYSFDQDMGTVNDPRLWSVDDPYVYRVSSAVSVDGNEVDQMETPTGFRWFFLENGSGFELNGEAMLIRGTNRHQDMEGYGYALPNSQHIKDIEIIKDIGFNFLRHAHYPPDPVVLDMTDSLGLMVWCELPLTGSMDTSQAFTDNATAQLREMIRQHYNHPSIVMWGLGNETDWTSGDSYHTEQDASDLFNTLNSIAHSMDPDRKTSACNLMGSWPTKDIPDIYSPQAWWGWYNYFSDFETQDLTQFVGEYGADVHRPNHEEFEPLLEIDQTHQDLFSQEWALRLLENYLPYFDARKDQMPGACLWITFDFASPRSGREYCKIPYMNQKGLLLHDHETPKDTYYFMKSMYKDAAEDPIVYIHSETWTDRWASPAAKNVWVYSNCDSVELFNNYAGSEYSFGMQTRKTGERGETRFQWDDAYVEYNVLFAVGYYNGGVVAVDTLILENLDDPPEVDVIDRQKEEKVLQKQFNVPCGNLNNRVPMKLALDRSSKVSISIYSITGRLIENVINQELDSGRHTFYWNRKNTASGIFYVRCSAGNKSFTRKIVIND